MRETEEWRHIIARSNHAGASESPRGFSAQRGCGPIVPVEDVVPRRLTMANEDEALARGDRRELDFVRICRPRLRQSIPRVQHPAPSPPFPRRSRVVRTSCRLLNLSRESTKYTIPACRDRCSWTKIVGPHVSYCRAPERTRDIFATRMHGKLRSRGGGGADG